MGSSFCIKINLIDEVICHTIIISFQLFCDQRTKAKNFCDGKIINPATGKAVPNASVGLKNSSDYTTTDSTGHFTLKGIDPGKYVLSAYFLGYKEILKDIKVSDKDLYVDLFFETM